MRTLYSSMVLTLLFTTAQGQTWTSIATDPSGDSGAIDATELEYWYDAANDEVQFRITVDDLATYSSSPSADFGFLLPNGMDGGFSPASGPGVGTTALVHKAGYAYCDQGGSPGNYTFNVYSNDVVVMANQTSLCTGCIAVVADVPNNQLMYTFNRQDIISDTEMGGSSATIGVVSNAGYNQGWNDNITQTATMTIDLTTSVAEQTAEESISIFPNPAMDMLTVSATQLQGVDLIDVTGKQVATISKGVGNTLSLNVSEYNAGVYFVNVHFADGATSIRKVTIQ